MTPPRDPRAPRATPEALLAHAGWVRELARGLVGDPHVADDLQQEAMAAALREPPAADRPLQGWLAAVVRNLARQRARGEGRRSERERIAARAEELPSADGVLERADVHRRLVELVLALDEPYRTVLLLRYFDGLPPRAIAARTGAPLETVRTRLARGLDRLRGELDRSERRSAWMAALLPLARRAAPAPPPTWANAALGALLVNAKLVAALALVLAVGGFAVSRLLSAPAGEPVARAPLAAPVAAAAEPVAPLPRGTAGAAVAEPERAAPRAPVARSEAPAPEPAAAPAPRRVRGRLLDADGQALVGLAVGFAGGANAPRGTSGPGGAFELLAGVDRPVGTVVALEDGWATVLSGVWSGESRDAELAVVAARAVDLAGVAVDAAAAPLAGAAVAVLLPDDLRARFSAVLDFSRSQEFAARTGADGGFALRGVPAVRGARLAARKPGYAAAELPLPLVSDEGLQLVLHEVSADRASVAGRVVDRRGAPVPGARVALGLDATSCDDDGWFRLGLADPSSHNARARRFVEVDDALLVAAAPGHLPGSFRAERDASGRALWPEVVTLQLGGTPLEIAGRVVDPRGEPVAGALVWTADPTVLGFGDRGPQALEAYLGGREGSPWGRVETDELGRFSLAGYGEREYVVEAMDARTLVRESVTARGGDRGVVIALPTDAVYAVLRGRVVTRAGVPIPGVEVQVVCDALRTSYAGRVMQTSHGGGDEIAVTDEEGRFALHDVPREHAYLRLDGEEMLPVEYGRHVEGGLLALVGERPEEVEIEAPVRCHFRVELAPSEADRTLRVLDAAGEALPIDQFVGNGRRTMRDVPFPAGAPASSAVLATSDAAATLVVLEGEVEVARTEIALVPGEVTTLRP